MVKLLFALSFFQPVAALLIVAEGRKYPEDMQYRREDRIHRLGSSCGGTRKGQHQTLSYQTGN